jgi:hypothetical protein
MSKFKQITNRLSAAILVMAVSISLASSCFGQRATLQREENDHRVYQVFNNTKRWIPNPTTLERFGGASAVRVVPSGGLSMLPELAPIPSVVPGSYRLVRESNRPEVYLEQGGRLHHIPDERTLYGFFNRDVVEIVPPGSLLHHPRELTFPHYHLAAPQKVIVNVYKIWGVTLIWHSGIEIDGREYFFDNTNRVLVNDNPGKMPQMSHRRRMEHDFPSGDALERIQSVIQEFNGTRYDLGKRNCNVFVDRCLETLGLPRLDREYLDSSGLQKGLRQFPGGSTGQEFIKVVTGGSPKFEEAIEEDVDRIRRLPGDIVREAKKPLEKVAESLSRMIR